MKNLFNLFDKYKKYICLAISAISILLMCFPCHDNRILGFTTPYFFKFITYFYFIANLMVQPFSKTTYGLVVCYAFACALFLAFLILAIWFLIRLFKGKNAPFIIPLTVCLICFSLLQVQDSVKKFEFTATYIVFCIFFAIYFIGFIVRVSYPRMRPKVAETVGKVADKVKSHKSKSERIEELERQNAEIQKQLDELKRKD